MGKKIGKWAHILLTELGSYDTRVLAIFLIQNRAIYIL